MLTIRLTFSFEDLVKILKNSMTIVLKKKLGTMLTCSTRQAFSFKDLVDYYYHIKKKTWFIEGKVEKIIKEKVRKEWQAILYKDQIIILMKYRD